MGCYIQKCYHSGMFTGAQPGVPGVASVQTLGALVPLCTEEWLPSYNPTLHGAQADTSSRALHKVYTAGARLHVLAPTCALAHAPTPCTCARHCRKALAQTPAALRPLLLCRATQHAQVCVFQGGLPVHSAKHSEAWANTAMANPQEHWLRGPPLVQNTCQHNPTCAAGQPHALGNSLWKHFSIPTPLQNTPLRTRRALRAPRTSLPPCSCPLLAALSPP